jgi:hypothetical protein
MWDLGIFTSPGSMVSSCKGGRTTRALMGSSSTTRKLESSCNVASIVSLRQGLERSGLSQHSTIECSTRSLQHRSPRPGLETICSSSLTTCTISHVRLTNKNAASKSGPSSIEATVNKMRTTLSLSQTAPASLQAAQDGITQLKAKVGHLEYQIKLKHNTIERRYDRVG